MQATDESPYETFRVERRGDVDWLTLDRPGALNAMNALMIAELAEYFGARVYDTQTRVIVLRAAGNTFCAGLDLREMTGLIKELDTAARLRFQQRLSSIFVSMRRCPQPIVCLVQGAAAGGGFALALAADIRLCTPEARMNAAFIKVGLSGCDVGMSYLLPRAVGTSVAAEMLLTGSFLDAARAAALGFVSAVVPAAELEAAGAKTVESLLQADPLGLALTKQGLQVGIDAPGIESAIANEDRQQSLLSGAEGLRAGCGRSWTGSEPGAGSGRQCSPVKPRNRNPGRHAALSTSTSMRGRRRASDVNARRPSSLASCCPMQWWMPPPNDSMRESLRVTSSTSARSNTAGSRLAAPSRHSTRSPGCTLKPPTSAGCDAVR